MNDCTHKHPYACDVSQKIFTSMPRLVEHDRLFAAERLHACNVFKTLESGAY